MSNENSSMEYRPYQEIFPVHRIWGRKKQFLQSISELSNAAFGEEKNSSVYILKILFTFVAETQK